MTLRGDPSGVRLARRAAMSLDRVGHRLSLCGTPLLVSTSPVEQHAECVHPPSSDLDVSHLSDPSTNQA